MSVQRLSNIFMLSQFFFLYKFRCDGCNIVIIYGLVCEGGVKESCGIWKFMLRLYGMGSGVEGLCWDQMQIKDTSLIKVVIFFKRSFQKMECVVVVDMYSFQMGCNRIGGYRGVDLEQRDSKMDIF